MRSAARSRVSLRVLAKGSNGLLMLLDQGRDARSHRLLDRAISVGRASGNGEALHLAVELAQEVLHLVHEVLVLLRYEVGAPLLPDGEEVGLPLKELLDEAG